jgi:hypothetical protein
MPTQYRGKEPCLLLSWLLRLADKRVTMIGGVPTDLAGPSRNVTALSRLVAAFSSELRRIQGDRDEHRSAPSPQVGFEFELQDRAPETTLVEARECTVRLMTWPLSGAEEGTQRKRCLPKQGYRVVVEPLKDYCLLVNQWCHGKCPPSTLGGDPS